MTKNHIPSIWNNDHTAGPLESGQTRSFSRLAGNQSTIPGSSYYFLLIDRLCDRYNQETVFCQVLFDMCPNRSSLRINNGMLPSRNFLNKLLLRILHVISIWVQKERKPNVSESIIRCHCMEIVEVLKVTSNRQVEESISSWPWKYFNRCT